MLFFLIIGLILGAIAVIFALQNIMTIPVTFLLWQVQGSLALILILAVISGILISVLVSIPEVFNDYRRYTALKKQNKKLEEDIETYKKMVTELNLKMSQVGGVSAPILPPTDSALY